MKRKILIVMLLALKLLLRKGSVALTIRSGPNKGLLWKFGKNSNNEFILGTWEMPIQEVFLRYLKANDVVYDLGAHQGFLALIVSRLVGEKGRVYAFEPLPANFDFLKEHVRINNITNCKELSPLVYLETHNIHSPGVDSACRDFLVSIGYGIKEELITHNEGFGSYIFQKL